MKKTCVVCGNEFEAAQSNYIICSDECREKREQEYKQQYSNLFGNSTGMVVKEEDKDVYKRIYRIASLKLHPDVAKDNGRAMRILNKLKEQWGI